MPGLEPTFSIMSFLEASMRPILTCLAGVSDPELAS
jgi:hypothetical protein